MLPKSNPFYRRSFPRSKEPFDGVASCSRLGCSLRFENFCSNLCPKRAGCPAYFDSARNMLICIRAKRAHAHTQETSQLLSGACPHTRSMLIEVDFWTAALIKEAFHIFFEYGSPKPSQLVSIWRERIVYSPIRASLYLPQNKETCQEGQRRLTPPLVACRAKS